MSIEAIEQPAISTPSLAGEGSAAPLGFATQAVQNTLGSLGARIGLVWLGILLFFAVFAPFLANSHPLFMKADGHYSSPLLHSLAPSDLLVLLAFFMFLALRYLAKVHFWASVAIVVASVIIAAYPLYRFLPVPGAEDYSRFRVLAAGGQIEARYVPIPYSPSDRLRDQANPRLLPPDRYHWLGTDSNGADLASNVIHASRIALSIGFISTSLNVFIGMLVGGLMGYYAGWLDLFGMRLIEIFESMPRLFILISITAFIEHRDIYLMMLVLGITDWTGYARFLRGEFFTLRKLDYVQAAIASGLPVRSVIFRHLLPNGLTPILVNTTFSVASAILFESTLSFLGLGLVDEASWGSLLNQARAGGTGFIWWIALFPGLAIFLTVFAYNLVGEAVRDALDPKLQSQATR